MPPGQNFAVIIVVAPREDGTTSQYAKQLATSVLGAFDTVEECKAHIDKLHASGFDLFDMHIVKMNAFLPLPPPKEGTTVEYRQEILQSLFKGHQNEANAAERLIDERIALDKKTEDILRKKSQAEQRRPLTDEDASTGAVVDSDAAKKRNERVASAAKEASRQTSREDLNRKLREAKKRARQRGTSLSKKKRKAVDALMRDAISRIESADADPDAGLDGAPPATSHMFSGLPSMAEVLKMTPEQKEAARIQFEGQLPDPTTNPMRCEMGSPRSAPPPGAKVIDLRGNGKL
jgi:hypothetical protein